MLLILSAINLECRFIHAFDQSNIQRRAENDKIQARQNRQPPWVSQHSRSHGGSRHPWVQILTSPLTNSVLLDNRYSPILHGNVSVQKDNAYAEYSTSVSQKVVWIVWGVWLQPVFSSLFHQDPIPQSRPCVNFAETISSPASPTISLQLMNLSSLLWHTARAFSVPPTSQSI